CVMLPACPRERSGPRRAGFVWIGAAVQQKFYHFDMPPTRSVTQWRRTIFVVDIVDISTIPDQQARLTRISGVGHVVQQRELAPVHVIRVHALVEQKRCSFVMFEIVARAPFGNVRNARAIVHQYLEHAMVTILRRHSEDTFTPERSLIESKLRTLLKHRPYLRVLAIINQLLKPFVRVVFLKVNPARVSPFAGLDWLLQNLRNLRKSAFLSHSQKR